MAAGITFAPTASRSLASRAPATMLRFEQVNAAAKSNRAQNLQQWASPTTSDSG